MSLYNCVLHVLLLGIHGSGLSSADTSTSCHPDMLHGAGMFLIDRAPSLPPSQFMYQTGPPPSVSGGSGAEIGTDVGYRSTANKIPQQTPPWAAPSTSVPSLSVPDMSFKTVGLPEEVSFQNLQQNVSGTFCRLMPDVSLQSQFPGSSDTGFDRSSVTSSVHSLFGVSRVGDMLSTVPGPVHLPHTQPAAQRDPYLYDEEGAFDRQLTCSLVVSVPNSGLTQGFPGAGNIPLTALSHSDQAQLVSSRLHVDQQPVRLLLPPPVFPPRPPLILTSGQPSNLPIGVGAPLAVMQEAPSMELPPVPVLPVPTHFMLEQPVHMHQVPRPGLMTEQSPVKLQSSPVVGLIPPFLSDPPLQTRSAPHVLLQEVPSRPPAVVRMPSLAPPGEVLQAQQRAVSDMAPGPMRPPPAMPASLLDIECHPVGRQPLAPTLVHDLPEDQPTCEPQSDATNLRLQDTADQISAQLRSEYPGSHMLPNPTREMLPQSDRPFAMPPRPLMAPGQMLGALQGLPAPQMSHLPRHPTRESLRLGMSPIRVSDTRSQELSRIANTLPVMEHDNISSLGRLEPSGVPFSSSSFSSRLPAPSAVMASSRLSEDRFHTELQHREFTDQPESDMFSDYPVDRVRPLSHLTQFSSTSNEFSSQPLTSDRTRVRSLLDENLLEMSQSGSSPMDMRASVPTRRWKDRSGGGGGMLTVGELKAALRQQDNANRRRTFRHSSEDSTERSSYEPPSKFTKCADDVADEPKDVPLASNRKCDSHDDKDIVSSSHDAASAAVTEASDSNSCSES